MQARIAYQKYGAACADYEVDLERGDDPTYGSAAAKELAEKELNKALDDLQRTHLKEALDAVRQKAKDKGVLDYVEGILLQIEDASEALLAPKP